MDDFHGYPVRHLTSRFLELDCLATAGPRIVGLRFQGSPNLLADVSDVALPTAYGEYHYLGGHRLWYAPEAMPRSYIPDNEGVTVSELPNGLILDGRVEAGTGIQKRLQVRLDPDRPRVALTHTLTNQGLWEVELAPWAITMFRLGGTVILPCRADQIDRKALLPDRRISIWPYSDIGDPRLMLENDFIAVRPRADLLPFKIGTFNPKGWTAYWLENTLFRKVYATQLGFRYPDNDCNAEIYCDADFIELESLSPFCRLAPGDSVTHEEIWELYDSLDQRFLSQGMIQTLRTHVADRSPSAKAGAEELPRFP